MSSTITEVDKSTLEDLDFQFVQPCEVKEHNEVHKGDQPAMFLVTFECSNPCYQAIEFFLCLSGWEMFGKFGVKCMKCLRDLPRDDVTKIIRVIGS